MIIKGKINGCFGKKDILYSFLTTSKSNDFFIFFHGLYGSSYEDERYQDLANRLIKDKIGNVFLFETSRKTTYATKPSNYEQYKSSFEGKTFNDELDDVTKAVDFLIIHLIKKTKNIKLHLIGFSLGGTIASYMIGKYKKYIKNIFLFGSGITTRGNKQPITSTYPSSMVILNNYYGYEGGLFLIQGECDTVVSTEPAKEVLSVTDSKNKDLIIVKGADHSFRKINGECNIKKLNDVIYKILTNKKYLKT